jgi:hypothetical protein
MLGPKVTLSHDLVVKPDCVLPQFLHVNHPQPDHALRRTNI